MSVGTDLKLAAVLLGLNLCGWSAGGAARAQAASSAARPEAEERQLLVAAEKEPGNLQAVGSLGAFYLAHERWQESAQWLTRAYALSGGDRSIGYDLAYAEVHAGQWQSARRQIGLLLEGKEEARLHSLLAAAAAGQGSYAEAAREYRRAAELDPSESNLFELATFLLQHKQYVGALEDSIRFFRYGVTQFPRSSQMRVGLGVALYADQHYDEAVRVLCEAVDLDPKDTRPIEFLGRASRVSPALAEEVDRRLEDFVTRYPDSAATNYFCALGLWERGGSDQGKNLDKIERLLGKAKDLAPGWYEPHYQLGVLYESEKRMPEAIRELRRAVVIDPDFFPAHYRLAVLYNKEGERAKAAEEAALVKQLKDREGGDQAKHDVTE